MRYLIATIVIAIVAIGGDYWYVNMRATPKELYGDNGLAITEDTPAPPGFADPAQMPANDTRVRPASQPLLPARTPPAGSNDYRNEHYRFELFYPQNLSVKEFDEGKGAVTITFQNPADSQGFQMFIVPYGERQVSAARFKQDEPSGVLKQPLDIQIDGTTGTTFEGHDTFLGDTREVWFIHDGYLFEITAPLSLDSWLTSIMITWKFI
jgi:hypothetical protein